jgi:hypothetical protein
MDKLESHTLKEAAWRSRLQRHARSRLNRTDSLPYEYFDSSSSLGQMV